MDTRYLSETVFSHLGFRFPFPITQQDGKNLRVEWAQDKATVYTDDKNAFTRGVFLLCKAYADGKTSLSVTEKRHISSCGAMIDCSRGGVMNVESVKKMLDAHAALGLNLFMLYTEDTYTLPGYPYFGHFRGRYTQDELRELDAYALSLGIELVPCIQTLAHLQQYLQWSESEQLKDNDTCLLIDEEDTHRLIETMISTSRACFTSKRIHIGMDEAHGVGLGRYYQKHGATDRFQMLCRHLGRVVELCKKYDFHPMMWSDMFFRIGSKTNAYYDLESEMPESVIKTLPDADMVYWDYYHTDEDFYDKMLTKHEQMGRTAVYAGGIWTWSGFLPYVEQTDTTMYPALKACARHGIDTVIATMWGDDGNETSELLAMNQLPIFSEYCWQGEDCEKEVIEHTGEVLTGLKNEFYRALGMFYPEPGNHAQPGKGLIYCDLLYDLLPNQPDLNRCMQLYSDARAILKAAPRTLDIEYADTLFDIAILKAETILKIRKAYPEKDMDTLRAIAQNTIPTLIQKYDLLEHLHRTQWMNTFKRSGWEIFPLRYGSVRGRLKDCALVLTEFISGKITEIPELSEPPMNARRHGNRSTYRVMSDPQY